MTQQETGQLLARLPHRAHQIAGLIGIPERTLYHASKHRVIGLTKSAAFEYAVRGHLHYPSMAGDDRDADGGGHVGHGTGDEKF